MKSDCLCTCININTNNICSLISDNTVKSLSFLNFFDFDKSIITKINKFKREMNYMRKTVRPTHDFLTILSDLETDLIQKETNKFIGLVDLELKNKESDLLEI